MEKVGVVSMLVVCSIFVLNSLHGAYANAEGDALIAFKNKLVDPNNALQSWDPTLLNPCTWYHITCNDAYNVAGIDLGFTGLSGELAPDLAKLAHLEHLYLYKNSITGKIPEEFGIGLTNLVHLDLSNNFLNGTLPRTLFKLTKLETLNLSTNAILDNIPNELRFLTNLWSLDLSINAFYGEIPESLGELRKLSILRLSDNVLSGPIRANIANLPILNVLDLSLNNLNGTLPEWNGNPTGLSIELNNNELSGSVPASWDTIIQTSQLVDLTSNPALTGQCTVSKCVKPN